MSRDNLYNRTVNITRAVYTADELGGNSSKSYALVRSNVPCRFNSLFTKEMLWDYDKKTVFANYKVYLEYLDGLKEGDRLVLDDGSVYDVKLIIQWDMAKTYMELAVMEVR
jgi:hypothetical protein